MIQQEVERSSQTYILLLHNLSRKQECDAVDTIVILSCSLFEDKWISSSTDCQDCQVGIILLDLLELGVTS